MDYKLDLWHSDKCFALSGPRHFITAEKRHADLERKPRVNVLPFQERSLNNALNAAERVENEVKKSTLKIMTAGSKVRGLKINIQRR